MELIVKTDGNRLDTYNKYALPTESMKIIREKRTSKLPLDHKEHVKITKMLQHGRANIQQISFKRDKLERELLYNKLLVFVTTLLCTDGVMRLSGGKVITTSLKEQEVSMLL